MYVNNNNNNNDDNSDAAPASYDDDKCWRQLHPFTCNLGRIYRFLHCNLLQLHECHCAHHVT